MSILFFPSLRQPAHWPGLSFYRVCPRADGYHGIGHNNTPCGFLCCVGNARPDVWHLHPWIGYMGPRRLRPTATAANRFSVVHRHQTLGWVSDQWGTFAVAVSNTSTATSIAISYPSNIQTSGCGNANCRISFGSGAVANGASASASTFSSGAPNIAG